MKKQYLLLTAILVLLLSYILPYTSTTAKAAAKEPFTLTIMHVNDTHANVEQFPKIATAVKEVRAEKPNSLLVHAGDVFSGTLYFNQYSGLADLWFMNNLGFDAMTLGNHEFDKDSKTLANFLKEMKFPVVSANVDVSKDAELGAFAKKDISETPQGGDIYPAIIKEVAGEKIGIFGLTTEDTTYLANPSKDIVFENSVEKAKTTVAALKAKGINKIVALSHLGFGPDQELAKAVDGIDVIVGGHSHTKVDQPIVIQKDEPTVIVQANEYLKYLGVVDVTFDDKGVVTSANGNLLDMAAYNNKQDLDAKAKVDELKAPLENLKKQIVGSAEVDLNGERGDVRTKETNLGNLIADAMAQRANEILKNNTTIAMQNGGGVRASIKKGDVSLGDIYTVMPFANLLVTLDLTGQEIWDSLEHGVAKVADGAGQFMQVAGLQYKFDPDKPAGSRVWEVNVKTAKGYEPIDLKKTYSVATNAFAADGGDGYTIFKKAKDEGRIHELLIVDYEILVDYFASHSPVSPAVEGRIVVQAQPQIQTGWIQENGFWYYYNEKGVKQTGWLALGYETFYLDPTTGAMQQGLLKIEGKLYYFDTTGAMKKGWFQNNQKWYFFNADGSAKIGWLTYGDKVYYLDENGVMQTGWQMISGNWYLFNFSGVMFTGWVVIEDEFYYFNKDGVMQTGWVSIDGDRYYFDEDGVNLIGWVEIDGKHYYFDLETGAMKVGWLEDQGKGYFLDANGVRQTGWVLWYNQWYYLDANGVMKTGWVKYKNKWYYLDSKGAMKTGWILYKNKWYYLDSDGSMKTGWVLYKNKWYYLDSEGAMKTGWALWNNKWYYLDSEGVMKMGWVLYNKNWYFLDSTGAMKTGWVLDRGKWYYLFGDGHMASNTMIQGYKLGADGAWIRK